MLLASVIWRLGFNIQYIDGIPPYFQVLLTDGVPFFRVMGFSTLVIVASGWLFRDRD